MPPPFQFRGNGPPRGPRNQDSKPQFTFRVPISERPLLRGMREPTPELLFPETGPKPAPKFASVNDLSDSEEAEMDFSDDESDAEARPRKKRVVALDGNAESALPILAGIPAPTAAPLPPKPKWSNPDPYTALPPPDESQHKRLDVVKLIRKARLAAAQPKANDAVVDNVDFISLGGLGDDAGASENQALKNAPKGPKGMEIKDSAAASRKRTRDDQPKPLTTKTGKPLRRFKMDGSILDNWMPLKDQNATPWIDTMTALNPATR